MKTAKGKIDIINEVLEDCILAFPVSSFIISLYQRYQKMGSLSKKQLQGLHSKASTIEGMSVAKLGTLEAIIKRMPTRFKSPKPEPTPLFKKNEEAAKLIDEILSVFPAHKRVLFLKSSLDNHQELSAVDLLDLKRFKELANKKLK
ncbi:MAG TPA: hypothetical protein VKR32_14300 [Puia sp.]|nr:hypothetical protein [Puia sp.]